MRMMMMMMQTDKTNTMSMFISVFENVIDNVWSIMTWAWMLSIVDYC